MRIITWNCNMAFRKKAKKILAYKPDLLVIPECENLERLHFENARQEPKDALWFGENPNKGLGIFSYSNFKFKLLDVYNPQLKMIIPIAVTNDQYNFILFAIWANNPGDPEGQYVTQTWKALHHYDNLLSNNECILTGDFNSNTIWDRPRREGNHTTVVEYLERKGIYSVYHKHFNQTQGKEKHPTWYMYRHRDKPYHLDYCFASASFVSKLQSVKVGRHATWTKLSDHVPVIANFDI